MIKSWLKDIKKQPNVLHFSNLASIPEVTERLNYFRDLSSKGLENLTADEYEKLHSEILEYFNAWGCLVGKLDDDTLFYRATVNKRITGKNEHHLTKVSQLTGPPKAVLTRRGRSNGLKIPVFYCASSFKTAIFEASPEGGDYVTVSGWKLRPGKVFHYAQIFHPDVTHQSVNYKGMLDEYKKTNRTQPPLLNHIRTENEKFLTEEFIKDVDGVSELNYLFSSTFSEIMFEKRKNHAEPLSGILYPSTKIRDGNYNLAMPDEIVHEYFELKEICFVEVKEIVPSDVDFRKIEVIFNKPPRFSQDFNVAENLIGHYETRP